MQLSYTIWFSQRNGSSLLSQALCDTGIAGFPGEHFPLDQPLRSFFGAESGAALLAVIQQKAMSPNGVIAFKQNAINRDFLQSLKEAFADVPGLSPDVNSLDLWETLFPNHHHIFLTRRNKVRQAVSWWKAIQTQEWHRKSGAERPYSPEKLRDQDQPDALLHLLKEIIAREAAIQEMLASRNRTALTLVYEDFVQDIPTAVGRVLDYLGLGDQDYPIPSPAHSQLADELSEEWVERFRQDLQRDWKYIPW